MAPALLDLGVAGLRVCVEEPAGKAYRVGSNPDGSLLVAAVSIWIDSYDNRAPHEAALAAVDAQAYGWIVAESEARSYGDHRTWPDGEQSPGLSITTFFDKKAEVDDETFYRIWHGEHTPLSFEIHPFWLYVRNQVLRSITPGAPPVRGIVYEAVPTDEQMLDFTQFFGCRGRARPADGSDPARGRPHGHVRQHRHAAVRPDARVDLPHPLDLRLSRRGR